MALVKLIDGQTWKPPLKVLNIDLFSIGRIAPEGADQLVEAEVDGKYYCFIFSNDRMAGSILLGDVTLSTRVKKAIENLHDFATMLRKTPTVNDILRYLQEGNV